MSPLACKILLHFYVTPLRLDRNAMCDPELNALADFIADGMIEPREKGRVWVLAMLSTPYPQMRWIIPSLSTGDKHGRGE